MERIEFKGTRQQCRDMLKAHGFACDASLGWYKPGWYAGITYDKPEDFFAEVQAWDSGTGFTARGWQDERAPKEWLSVLHDPAKSAKSAKSAEKTYVATMQLFICGGEDIEVTAPDESTARDMAEAIIKERWNKGHFKIEDLDISEICVSSISEVSPS